MHDEPDGEDDPVYPQLVVKGDVLTVERVRGAKGHRRRSTTRFGSCYTVP
jgi:hypothetical protein